MRQKFKQIILNKENSSSWETLRAMFITLSYHENKNQNYVEISSGIYQSKWLRSTTQMTAHDDKDVEQGGKLIHCLCKHLQPQWNSVWWPLGGWKSILSGSSSTALEHMHKGYLILLQRYLFHHVHSCSIHNR